MPGLQRREQNADGHGVGDQHADRALTEAKHMFVQANAGPGDAEADCYQHRPEKQRGGDVEVFEQLTGATGHEDEQQPLGQRVLVGEGKRGGAWQRGSPEHWRFLVGVFQ